MTAEESLWNFAVRVYDRPGVEAACLELQDSFGADVPVLIFGLWAGARGWRLSRADYEAAVLAVAPWQQRVVAPLRAVRRALKRLADFPPGVEAATGRIGSQVKALELDAERCELEFLETLGSGAQKKGGVPPVEANLAAYLEILGVPPHRFSQQKRSLLTAVPG